MLTEHARYSARTAANNTHIYDFAYHSVYDHSFLSLCCTYLDSSRDLMFDRGYYTVRYWFEMLPLPAQELFIWYTAHLSRSLRTNLNPKT